MSINYEQGLGAKRQPSESLTKNPEITPDLLQEFASMRNTLAQFVQVIKRQDDRIRVLETKLEQVPQLTGEQVLLDRYTLSSQTNRALDADAKVIALSAHLYYIKQVPAVRISKSGLLSQSKMHGLTSWDKQHLIDFCELNGVSDIYLHGLPLDEIKAMMANPDFYQEYLDRK